MGENCSMQGRHDRCTHNFFSKTLKGRHHLGDVLIDGKIILEEILKKQDVKLSTEGRILWSAFA
jgi:hypothetical protein